MLDAGNVVGALRPLPHLSQNERPTDGRDLGNLEKESDRMANLHGGRQMAQHALGFPTRRTLTV